MFETNLLFLLKEDSNKKYQLSADNNYRMNITPNQLISIQKNLDNINGIHGVSIFSEEKLKENDIGFLVNEIWLKSEFSSLEFVDSDEIIVEVRSRYSNSLGNNYEKKIFVFTTELDYKKPFEEVHVGNGYYEKVRVLPKFKTVKYYLEK